MTFNFKALVSTLGFVLVSACATDRGDIGDGTVGGSGSTDTACDPGKSQGCSGSDGRNGSQTCSDDGDKFGTCECTGTVQTNCTAGKSQSCTCSDGRNGSQVCNSSGSAYDACSCTGPLPGTGGNTGVGGATSVVDNDKDDDGYVGKEYGGPDCNDSNKAINPSATEICDSVDNNCNNSIDENGVCGSSTTTPVTTDSATETVTMVYTLPEGISFNLGGGIFFKGWKLTDNMMVDFCSTPWGDVSVNGRVYTCIAKVAPGWEKRQFNVDVERPNGTSVGEVLERFYCYETMGNWGTFGTLTINGKDMTNCKVDNGGSAGGCNVQPNKC